MPVDDQSPWWEVGGVRFGTRAHQVVVTRFDPGMGDVRSQDAPSPASSRMLRGRDYASPPTWTFELGTHAADATAAKAVVAKLATVWRDPRFERPGTSVPLRYSIEGDVRRVWGRPKRFTPPDYGFLTHQGMAEFQCDFQLDDPRSFADVLSSASLTLVPESSGGLIAPLIAPLTGVARGGVRAGVVNVGGTAPAPVRVAFHGPVSNPVVFTDEWEIGLTGNLAWDVEITVDALTGEAFNQDGASVGGRLTRRTRLRKAALSPGPQEIRFTGADATGTATATVSWRDAAWGI